MKKRYKVLITFSAVPFLALSLYIIFLWLSYIDNTVLSGESYGFTIGQTKSQTYRNVLKSIERNPKLKIHINYGPRAGDNMTFSPTNNYIKAQNHNNWSLLLDGDNEFFNVIRLKFENNKLSEIYRHRKYFEMP